jgi:molecular chaperone DnaK
LIERNTTIPTRKSETFTTAADNQTSVEIHVLQGEREMARDNRTLGKFHLVGIPPAPRGIPQIEVTFDIDANGIVNVSAKDLGTGKEQQITITASSGLSENEIDQMVRDAESHSEDDKKKRESVDVRNQADSLVYQTEKLLNENREKIPASDISAIEEAIKETKEAIESNDVTQMRTAIDNLTKASHRMAEAMYQQQTQQQAGSQPGPEAGGPQPGSEKKDEDVVDAEFEDVN